MIATNNRRIWSGNFNILGLNNVVTDTLSRVLTMDEVPNKNILSNDVQKKCACTQDMNDEFPLDASVIAKAQPNELSLRTSDLRHKVCEERISLCMMYDTHEIFL